MIQDKSDYTYDVFISHSVKDKVKADAICHILEEHNIRCFYAPRDILPGENWDVAIEDALKVSNIFLLVFSKNAENSNYVHSELLLAIQNEHKIVPFMIDDTVPGKGFGVQIARFNWIDGISEPFIDRVTGLARGLHKLINGDKINKRDVRYLRHNKGIKQNLREKWYVAVLFVLIAALAIGLICVSGILTPPVTLNGAGTAESPYEISSAEQLNLVRYDLDAYYILTSDIDLKNYGNWEPIGSSSNWFSGNFNGQNHTIHGLTVSGKNDYVGLFGFGRGGSISNLQFDSVNVFGDEYVGSLIGFATYEFSIEHCNVLSGKITGNLNTGGLIGAVSIDERDYGTDEETMVPSYVFRCNVGDGVEVVGYEYTGGLIGYACYVSVMECCSSAEVVRGSGFVGGLIGSASKTVVEDCYAASDIEGSSICVGGLIGLISGTNVNRCYASSGKMGMVTGYSSIGGLIGRADDYDFEWSKNSILSSISTIKELNSAGFQTSVHRVVGEIKGKFTQIGNCYASKETWINTLNPVMMEGTDLPDGEGRVSVMIRSDNRAFYEDRLGFDYVNVWKINSNEELPPVLQNEW